MPVTEQVLQLQYINKFYQDGQSRNQVLYDINLQLSVGCLAAITGPSGSGKSTLLNIIGCMDQADSGQYWLAGESVAALRDEDRAKIRRQYLGFVFQSYHLIPTLSILENISLPLFYQGVPLQQRQERAEQTLYQVGLAGFGQRKPSQLSGGQQQRIAIARAIVHQPLLLLADEPTGNLDSQTRDQVFALFQQLNQQGTSVLIVTHDPHIAERADKTLHICDGRLEAA